MKRLFFAILLAISAIVAACKTPAKPRLVVSSKFFTEQVVLAEMLAQHIEPRTGTGVTAVLGENPIGDSTAVYRRVKEEYARRFAFEVTEPLGFENTFAMVVRGEEIG